MDCSNLRCYDGNSTYLTGQTFSKHNTDFCAIYNYKSSTLDFCGEDICIKYLLIIIFVKNREFQNKNYMA